MMPAPISTTSVCETGGLGDLVMNKNKAHNLEYDYAPCKCTEGISDLRRVYKIQQNTQLTVQFYQSTCSFFNTSDQVPIGESLFLNCMLTFSNLEKM
jgi:hypothetical protein